MASKKENPADMSVEQKLKNLYQLQLRLSDIDKIRTLRGELPLEVQDLEDDIEGLSTRIGKYDEEIKHLTENIRLLRDAIASDNDNIARYKEQLNEVRNNREYDNLSKEIEFFELDIQAKEKKIREADAIIAQRHADIETGRQTLEQRRLDLEVKKSELDEIVCETKAEEEKQREKAKSIEATIDPRLLASFKRIRKNSRNGLGIVHVERDACGGCFNKIPPQRQLDIRMRRKIIICEYCGRIMIDPELAGVKIEKPAEEKPKRRVRKATKTKETKDATTTA
ncbi:MAG: hypothetical protein KBS47_04420 [Bacteroidales bacterium]|nr:hypothetical protein [Candidatus Equimonas enterica]